MGACLAIERDEMPKKKKSLRRPESSLPMREFLGPEYWRELQKEEHPQFAALMDVLEGNRPSSANYDPELWDAAHDWWPICLLREFGKAGKAEPYKRLLRHLLLQLDAQPPAGVVMPFKWSRGRPNETAAVYKLWSSKGQPELNTNQCDSLAREIFPEEYAKARVNQKLRKNLRDRIRATIRRHDKSATKTA